MERKYDMRFCKCGSVLPIEFDSIEKAVRKGSLIGYICSRCGQIRYIGADEDIDYDGNPCYNMFSFDGKDESFDIDENFFKVNTQTKRPVYKMIYVKAIRIPMKTGGYATYLSGDHFYDGTRPDFYRLGSNASAQEIIEFIKDWDRDSSTVNMDRLIRENTDEILTELSGYLTSAFNWKGTKYERK